MTKIFDFVKKQKKTFFIGGPVAIIVLLMIFGGSGTKQEIYEVKRATVEQSVNLSGQVMTSDRADLGFATSGRVARVFVENNQRVREGQTLAQLEIGDLLADLKIKQAGTQEDNTEETTAVENAYRTLLSEDLEFIPSSSNYNVEAPVISGLYNGGEGRYRIEIEPTTTALYYDLQVFDLERMDVRIEKNQPTPLGTKGLFISFPDDIAAYKDTRWTLEIPNKKGASYLANYNAYLEAKDALEKENSGGTTVAEAEIQKINAEIRKNTIYAPFSGIVTNIEKEVGESASTGERVVSILGENKLEVVLQVSELDVSRLVPGAQIEITIDALPNEKFIGTLKTVNSRETEIDGVPVYEAFVELAPDPRIKTGMSANGLVIIARKDNVIAVPSYLVETSTGKSIVKVIDAEGVETEREITTGLNGSDSMLEVISGLNEGDRVVSTPRN